MTMSATPPNQGKVDPSTGQFIDPLFAVIIAGGLTETVVAWVKSESLPGLYPFALTFVGFFNLLLSWFGYHKSVAKRPIRGSLRFTITVVLLPLYLLTIIIAKVELFWLNALVYAAIFFLWSTWDYLKYQEFKTQQPPLGGKEPGFWSVQRRVANLLAYGAAAFAVSTRFVAQDYADHWLVTNAHWVGLSLVVCAILALRIANAMKDPNHPAGRISAAIRAHFLGPQ